MRSNWSITGASHNPSYRAVRSIRHRARQASQAVAAFMACWLLWPAPTSGQASVELIDTFAIERKKGIQNPTAVAYNSLREEYLAVWSDERARAVVGRRIRLHPRRARAFRPERVISSVTGLPGEIALAYNSKQDTYLVAWVAFNQRKVWGTVVDRLGQPLGVGAQVSEIDNEADCRPLALSVVHNDIEDSWLVVWQDNCFSPRVELGSRARVIASDGSPVGPSFRLHQSGNRPAAAFDPMRNRYLVVREGQEGERIKGRFHGSDGEPLGHEFIVGRRRRIGQRAPALARIPGTDRWLVVWRDGDTVTGAIVDDLGALPAFPISSDDTDFSGPQGPASLAYSRVNQQVLVVWVKNNDVAGRWIDRAGKPRGDIRMLETGLALRGVSPQALACSERKRRCIVAWTEARRRSFFNNFDVFGGLLQIGASE